MFRYALHVADSPGMDVTIASAPGWSSTGGRWVTPQDAMKKLEWRSIETDGGGDIAVLAVRIPDEDFSACGRVISDTLITFSFDSAVIIRAVTLKSFQTGGRPYRGNISASVGNN